MLYEVITLTGTNSLPTGMTAFHHLVLHGSTTATCGISVSGNWTNNSGFIPGSYAVTFDGTTQSSYNFV